MAPNPLVIGETMEVKCSVDNIGGIGALPRISDWRVVRSVTLSKVVSGTSELIAKYLPFNADSHKVSIPLYLNSDLHDIVHR